MYYIYDVRTPKKPFLFSAGYDGKFIPAIYKDKSEAEKICDEMNQTSVITQYAVKEV